MQPDLKQDQENLSPQGSANVFPGHDAIPVSKSRVGALEVEQQEEALPYPADRSMIERLRVQKAIQERGIRQRRPISSHAMWRFFLLAGDTFFIVLLLTVFFDLMLHFHGVLAVPVYALNTWNPKLTWVLLALFSWSAAINLTRAQELVYVSNRFTSLLRMAFALVLMLIFWGGLSWLFFGEQVTSVLGMEALFLVLALPVLCAWRVVLFECMRLPQFRTRAVILGVNAAAEAVVHAFKQVKRPDTELVGYISERLETEMQRDGLPILGSRSALRYLVKSGLIDTMIIAFDTKANPELFQEAIELAQQGISVIPMTVMYERLTGKIPVQHIGEQWYGSLPSEWLVSPWYLYWRKVMDIAFGLIGSAALLALLPVLGLLIYLDSPGPIFYSQERVGYRGKPFRILKFRSMRPDAESKQAQWASQADGRVTRVGRFMRATHLDELPQVLNILRGEMSLIGPRPERQVFVDELRQAIPFYQCRLSVKPGLTGWAQVKYPYASSTEDALNKLQYDLYYVKHQSFTLDIFIILKTVIEVLLFRGR